jgi:hypothetical protein
LSKDLFRRTDASTSSECQKRTFPSCAKKHVSAHLVSLMTLRIGTSLAHRAGRMPGNDAMTFGIPAD